jgi:hypothetical protein
LMAPGTTCSTVPRRPSWNKAGRNMAQSGIFVAVASPLTMPRARLHLICI